jgi:hypothetical protein
MNLAVRVYDAPSNPVAFDAILLMNAPASALRNLLYHMSPRWSDPMYVAAVGILWYSVALNMDSLYARRTVPLFRWAPLRIATDLVLIALGPSSVWALRNTDLIQVARFDWPWFVPSFASCLFWAFGPPAVFGRDLVQSLRRRASEPPGIPHNSC